MRYLFYSLLCLMLSGKLSAQTVAIPDPMFRAFLVTYYSSLMNVNQELIISQAATLNSSFYCGEANLSSLEGIQYFVNITELLCFKNNLTALPDLSALNQLTALECYENNITVLPSLNSLVHLKTLNVGQNKLTTLPDLSKLTSLTQLSVYRNQLTSIPDLSNFSNLQRFACFENKLTSIGKMPASLKELALGDNLMIHLPDISLCTALSTLAAYTNRLDTLPDLAPYTALIELNLGTNRLTSVPASLSSLNQLTMLTLDNNLLTSLPDLSGLLSLTNCRFDNNKLSFEDILPSSINPNISSWKICPQDSLQAPPYNRVTEGQPLAVVIPVDESVPDLTFSWYRNGMFITQKTEPVLSISAASKADNGTWYCQVRSTAPALSGCTLATKSFTVVVRPDFTPDKEITITPNGDGENDEWLFEERGELKVYNSAGILLDQQATPCYWSGITSGGKQLGTGYYIIRINNDVAYQMTVIR